MPDEPRKRRRPSGRIKSAPLARRAPFFARKPSTVISVPSFSDALVKPRRTRVFGVPPSIIHLLTVPSGFFTSRWIHEWRGMLVRRPISAPPAQPDDAEELHWRSPGPDHGQLSNVFPWNTFSVSVFPATGPLSPHAFNVIVFSRSVLPVADPVGVTRNSMPAGFDASRVLDDEVTGRKDIDANAGQNTRSHSVLLHGGHLSRRTAARRLGFTRTCSPRRGWRWWRTGA